MRIAPLSLLLLAACQEYEFTDGPTIDSTPVGYAPADESVTDLLRQRDPVDEVDVLWVIDNSCSMQDDQDALTGAFPEFMDFFIGLADLDYHIGVVSTDMYDVADGQGQLREADGYRWIDRSVPDPIPYFTIMAAMGTNGSGDEMGRAGAYHALATQRFGVNDGFLRDDAFLSVVVISDEDDSSDMDGVDTGMFVSFLDGLKREPGMVSYSTIVGPTPDGCTSADAGYGYETVQQAVGGVFWSICDNQWDRLLEELAMAAAGMKQEFFLTRQPIVETLEVEVHESGVITDFEQGRDYTYSAERNSILFLNYVPQPYAEIVVRYDVE